MKEIAAAIKGGSLLISGTIFIFVLECNNIQTMKKDVLRN